jgi:hypothetical protein
MTPGIYDISNEEYHASDGISRSGIMLFKKSPLHFWDKYIREDREQSEQTEALVFGNALHTYILEPNEFFNRFAIYPQIDKRTKEGKEKWEEFFQQNLKKEFITQELYDQIASMSYVVRKHPFANDLITKAQYEKSIYWNDPDTGILCKCRPDILHGNMICDLKTTKDASEWAFRNSIYQYGYHIQAAMLQDGIKTVLNKTIEDFLFIAIEKTRPYATAVYILDKEALDMGREDYKRALVKYSECLKTNIWSGYERKYISLPNYAFYA